MSNENEDLVKSIDEQLTKYGIAWCEIGEFKLEDIEDGASEEYLALEHKANESRKLIMKAVQLLAFPKKTSVKNSQVHERVIYQLYPRKTGKQKALKAIAKALKSVDFETLKEAVEAYCDAVAKWTKDERRFIPHPASWFNAGCWEDDRSTWEREDTSKKKPEAAPFKSAPIARSLPSDGPDWKKFGHKSQEAYDDHRAAQAKQEGELAF